MGKELEPGVANATFSWDAPLNWYGNAEAFGDIEVLALLPHMHRRGRTMSIDFNIGGEDVCGGYVDRWDFEWQNIFWLKDGIPATADDEVQVTCGFDTTEDTDPVPAGFGTESEMCLVGLYIAER